MLEYDWRGNCYTADNLDDIRRAGYEIIDNPIPFKPGVVQVPAVRCEGYHCTFALVYVKEE